MGQLGTSWDMLGTSWDRLGTPCDRLGTPWDKMKHLFDINLKLKTVIYKSKHSVSVWCYSPKGIGPLNVNSQTVLVSGIVQPQPSKGNHSSAKEISRLEEASAQPQPRQSVIYKSKQSVFVWRYSPKGIGPLNVWSLSLQVQPQPSKGNPR